MVRVEVKPALLRWARKRGKIEIDELVKRFPRIHEWEAGTIKPTLKQLEKYADATHAPVGMLLLPEPPEEPMPIPDFRTIADQEIAAPSADLLDTVYICEQRQEWFREFARANREERVAFVGSMSTSDEIDEAAESMRVTLGFDLDERSGYRSWAEALGALSERSEAVGVLVMINGVVGSNTYRKLDPEEFRGFALSDDYAPIVFINGADTKAAQIFTLAHELAHIWLGQTGLDDVQPGLSSSNEVERWCSQVAAELLVPLDTLGEHFDPEEDLTEELDRLARVFKVSTLVVLRRIHDAGLLTSQEYRSLYPIELERVLGKAAEQTGSGGDFYNTTPVRVSKKFARAVIASTLEGQTPHREAARLLGFKNLATLENLGRRLGVD